MLHPGEPHPPVDARATDLGPWPLVVALAVIGPLAIAVGLAVLLAVAR